MKKHKLTLLIITMLVFLLCSCSQNSPVLPSDMAQSGTWEDLFKGLWTGLSDNYVFWDLDDANGEWDKVYEEFIPKFRELGSIDTSDREATKKGTILLFDSVKNLSDGHFRMDAFGSSFSPSDYRILKKEHPELSDQEVLEIIYDYYEKFVGKNRLPDDMLNEDSKSIMENTFSIPLTTTLEKTAAFINKYGSLYFNWRESSGGTMTCNALNPKIQLRTPPYGEAIMLYSSSHKYGSVTTYDGKILDFTSTEAFDNYEVSFPGEAIGPYYPVSDLSWEGNEQKLDSLFSDWTLCLVLSVNPEYDQTDKVFRKGVNLKMLALSGITKETDGRAMVDYTANTVYFISSGFNFLPLKDQAEMYQFLMDFHKFKMNENAAGMILDMRGNSGGYNADREILFGDMFREPHLIGYQKNKTGAGRLDLTQEFPLYIYPEADFFGNEFSDIASKPVVAITNTATASNGEITVLMVNSLPNGGQTGGVTIGANGTLDGNILTYNSGKFSVGNYITSVYTPYGNIRDTNHVSYEGKGLTPDKGYEETFNLDDFFAGTDSRLGKAFEWIKDHR
ncbi:MAG: S41 family peptidase [Bullifex sp.]|nr:S41 family peptidase [Bullifex sp.]